MQKALLCLFVSLLFLAPAVRAQVVAGIRANGRIIEHGDTINVCKGSTITYLSAAQGSFNITWRFNSGTPNTGAGIGPIVVSYNTNGYDTTFQKITGGAFADSTFIIVHVSDIKPVAAYTFAPNSVCGNIPVAFSNGSSTGDPLSFLWNFDDGSTTTETDPGHQFLTAIGPPGTQQFQVKLRVINRYGCADSVTRPVTIRKVPDAAIGNADATVSFGLFNGVPTFKKCSNIPFYNFKFTNQSTTLANNVSYTIQWGDGISPDSNFTNWPAGQVIGHTFPIGSSTMTVNVNGPDGCIGIKKFIVFLGTNPAGGLASLGNTDICSSDSLRFVINNVANNPPGTTYSFLINDGTEPQVFQHPPPTQVGHFFAVGSCSYSSNSGIQTYNNAFGAYLTIENPCGTNSASVVPIYVSGKPRPSIYLPTPVVCVNTAIDMINTSSYGNVINSSGGFSSTCINDGTKVWAISPATGYTVLSGTLGSLNGNPTNGLLWTNGSNALNIRFSTPGNYSIKIYIFNDRCGIDSTVRTLCVRNPPQASFNMSAETSCGPSTINFTNTSPAGGCQGDDYLWQVTYADPQGCAAPGGTAYSFAAGTTNTSASPSIQFNKPGRYIIKLSVAATNSPYGCPESVFTDTFFVKGPPVAMVAPVSTICIANTISPSATYSACYSPGPFGFKWIFQDGVPASSTDLSPGNVLYNITGNHAVRFIVTDSSCMSADTVDLVANAVPLPAAEAGADTVICSGEPLQLGAAGTPGVSYQWSPVAGLSNPTIANPAASLTYTGASDDTLLTYYVAASLGTNCNRLDSIKIRVKRKPVVILQAAVPQICIGNTVALAASGADTYQWANDLTLDNLVNPGVIATPIATTTYSVTGSLANGCTDTKNITITVNPDAKASFLAPVTVKCAPVNIDTLITNTHFPAGNGTYNWYANGILFGSNTTGVVPSYTMNTPGLTVNIRLVVLSANGCKPDSMEKTFVTVPAVTAGFTKDKDSSCAPLQVQFTNTSTAFNNVGFIWNFGNGITSTAVQPGIITFNASPSFKDTVYHIVLKAYNGCDTSYYRDSVKVFANARARFGVDTTRGCSPFTLTIVNTSMGNNFNYYWDFGDGQTAITHSLGTFTHQYNTGTITTYPVRLIAENQCGRDTQIINVVVSPNEIQPFVSANGNQLTGCAPHIVTFNNSTIGAAELTWDFGDNSAFVTTPNNQNSVTHQYTTAGNYTVTIRLRNDCSDTVIKRFVTVLPPPVAGFTVSPAIICAGQTISVTNTSQDANGYEWNWNDGSPVSSFANGQHTYTAAGVYTIRLVAIRVHPGGFVCTDTVTRQVTVVNRIPAQITVEPGKPCIPYSLRVNAGPITGYSQIEWIINDPAAPQPVTHLSGPSATYIYNTPGNYSISLIVHTVSGCTDTTEYSFEVHPTPKTAFDPMLVATCSHDTTIRYSAITTEMGNEPVNYKWFINGQQVGSSNPFSYHFQAPLTNVDPIQYNIQALAENASGCGDTSATGKFIIHPLPIPSIEVSPSLVQQQPDYTFTFKDAAAGNPNKTYFWEMGDHSLQTRTGKEVTYEYGDTGTYKIRLLVQDFGTGCEARDSVNVTILHVPGYLQVANALCLGCQNNSLRRFLPLGKGLKFYHLKIYNTWGQVIFETTKLNPDGSPGEAWDGTFKGKPLQQDAFSWQIEATYRNGTEWKGMIYPGSGKPVKAGFVTIIK